MDRTRIRHASPKALFPFLTGLLLALPAPGQEPPQPAAVTGGNWVVLTLRAPVGSISPTERAAIVNGRIERILQVEELRSPALVVRVLTAE